MKELSTKTIPQDVNNISINNDKNYSNDLSNSNNDESNENEHLLTNNNDNDRDNDINDDFCQK